MNQIKIGAFLALRSIKHSSIWTTLLIILVMLITFLNLIVVSGILVGLIQGSEVAFKEKYIGDVGIGVLEKKNYVERSSEIESILRSNQYVKGISSRYIAGGSIEANYSTRKSDDIANKKQVSIRGINPEDEDIVTKLSDGVIEGEYLTSADAGKYILVGKDVLAKYSIVADVDSSALRDVGPGSKVRIQINGIKADPESGVKIAEDTVNPSYEYTIKGIIKAKAGNLSSSIFLVDSELRKISSKNLDQVDEIAVRLNDDTRSVEVRDVLLDNGFGAYAKIQTFEEGTPAFVIQMKQLFGLLGTFFGSIAIVVAAITLFIVIFINALTKRRQIGILKGIGINGGTILWSYVFQAVFYALIGTSLGLLITFGFLKPYFDANPIDFPFSDGILVAEYSTTFIRVGILIAVSIFAGLIPSWIVVRRNTLNAILGR
jgi:putative ABC transport system permease protein